MVADIPQSAVDPLGVEVEEADFQCEAAVEAYPAPMEAVEVVVVVFLLVESTFLAQPVEIALQILENAFLAILLVESSILAIHILESVFLAVLLMDPVPQILESAFPAILLVKRTSPASLHV